MSKNAFPVFCFAFLVFCSTLRVFCSAFRFSVAAFQHSTFRVLVLPMRSSIFFIALNKLWNFVRNRFVTFVHKIVRSYKNCTSHLLLSFCFAVMVFVLVESVLKARNLRLKKGIYRSSFVPSINLSWKLLEIKFASKQGRSKLDNWGGGADIHIFVFTNHKSNWFQKKLIVQNPNIWISVPPIIELATALAANKI